ncbi:MAG: DUF4190 domain-containing protein [Planctomycetaceae bacterium]|jgi:hypothetical protein|nr:DUF4190 domain-containing protein [Planctomycetaceae bacterium]
MIHRCQFCDAEIAVTDGAVVPSAAMSVALARGYSPTFCPNWSVMSQRAAAEMERERAIRIDAVPVTDDNILSRWNKRISEQVTDWRFCNVCFSTLLPYLPPRPVYPSEQVALESWDSLKFVLPVNCSIWAIVAGYLGLFAVLIFPAPLALIFGCIALRNINAHKDQKLGGRGRAIFGIVMGLLFSIPLILILVSILFGGG